MPAGHIVWTLNQAILKASIPYIFQQHETINLFFALITVSLSCLQHKKKKKTNK